MVPRVNAPHDGVLVGGFFLFKSEKSKTLMKEERTSKDGFTEAIRRVEGLNSG